MMWALGASDCERLTDGALAQPVNAVTGLGLVVAGGWLIARGLRAPRDRVPPVVFGASVAAAGVGSVLYHGPQPSYADTVHDLSIIAVASQVVAYEVWLRSSGRASETGRIRVALGFLVLGGAAFVLGRTSSPLCDPDSPVQLHGAWHLLVAVSLATYGRARLGRRPA